MGKITDMLDVSLEELKKDGSKIMDENYMMGLFDKMKNDITSFLEYYRHMYEKKTIQLISPGDNSIIPLVVLKQELFSKSS